MIKGSDEESFKIEEGAVAIVKKTTQKVRFVVNWEEEETQKK